MRHLSRTSAATLAALVAFATACSDSTAPTTSSKVGLSFSTKPVGARLARTPLAPSTDVIVVNGADTLTVTRAQVVLGEIELKSAAQTACGADGVDDDCEELTLGPVLVDLPLTPGVAASSINVAIPYGTYSEMEFELDAVRSGEPNAPAFLAAHPNFDGVTVRIEGIYKGAPFVYTSKVDAEMELEFATPMVVDATGSNVTVSVDVAQWFRTATGAVIDPNSIESAGAIDENIRKSFRAFEDDDKDGEEN